MSAINTASYLRNQSREFGRPFRADSLVSKPRAKALGCSVTPFHGRLSDLCDGTLPITNYRAETLDAGSRAAANLSPLTSHQSLLTSP
jgi:hypothetical protein